MTSSVRAYIQVKERKYIKVGKVNECKIYSVTHLPVLTAPPPEFHLCSHIDIMFSLSAKTQLLGTNVLNFLPTLDAYPPWLLLI